MFKHFNFYIFLTTLGIVSVTHALDLQFLAEMMKLAEQKPHLLTIPRDLTPQTQNDAPPQNNAPPQNDVPKTIYAGKGSHVCKPKIIPKPTEDTGALGTVASNDPRLKELQKSVKYTSQDWGRVTSGGLQSTIKPEATVTSVSGCWVDGQYIKLQPGDNCNGLSQVTNTITSSSYKPSLPSTPTSVNPEYTTQSSFQPEYATRPLSKQTSFNYPLSQPSSEPTRPTRNQSPALKEIRVCYECKTKGKTEPPSPLTPLSTVLSSPSLITTTTETLVPSPSVSPLPTASSFSSPWGGIRRFEFGKNQWNDDTTDDTPKDEEENTSTSYSAETPNSRDEPVVVKETTEKIDPKESSDQLINNLLQENSGNTTTTKPELPVGWKKYRLNGDDYIAYLPKDRPAEYHSYERPVGLSYWEVEEIRNEVLTQNNYYRTKFGIRPLNLNVYMNNHAQEWANNLASTSTLRSRSSTENNLYGQNTFAYGISANIGSVAVDTWYNELRFIKVSDNEEDLKNKPETIGHMITLLWKGSREIGVGVAKNFLKMYFIVADYNPRGEIYPFFKDNLPEFKQSDIDDAKNAHTKSGTKVEVVNSSNGPPLEGTVTTKTTILIDPNDFYKNSKEPKSHTYEKPLRMSDDEVRLIRKDIIEKTNYYRRLYDMPDLLENDDINHYAQEWANTLGLIQDSFKHRPNDGNRIYGENLHMSIEFVHIGEIAADLWYYEIGLVHENDTEEELFNNHDAGHLTQLLWKRSKQVGCGAARYPDNKVVVVCNYNPTGNVPGLYLTNLPKFLNEHIEDGKRKQATVDEQEGISLKTPPAGQARRFPKWKSVLYPDESPQEDVVSPVPQSTDESSVTNGTSSDPNEQPVQTNTSPAINSDTYYAQHYRDPKPCAYRAPSRLTNREVDIIKDDVLRKSNEYRIKYGMPELVLNNDLSNYSQQWANYLVSLDIFERSCDDESCIVYGENIHKSNDFMHVGEIAVDLWYYQIGLVHENDTDEELYNKKKAKDLTQLLWKRSTQMGCGAARYYNGKVVIVCNYNPTGNVRGIYRENLPTFTQNDIEEGKKLQAVVNAELEEQGSLPLPGQKRRLKGWNSLLHDDSALNPPTSVQSNPPSPTSINPPSPTSISQSNAFYNISKEEVNQIRQDVFNKCNFYRNKHDIPVLSFSEEMNNSAQDWANHLGSTGAYSRKSSEQACRYGEIMLALPNVIHVGEFTVDVWYYKMAYLQGNEDEDKLFANMDSRDVTQLLWRATTTMGVGVSKYEHNNLIIVAHFDPAGNKQNEFMSNVPTFTVSEITMAREKLQMVDDAKGKYQSLSPDQTLLTVPNWTSDLH